MMNISVSNAIPQLKLHEINADSEKVSGTADLQVSHHLVAELPMQISAAWLQHHRKNSGSQVQQRLTLALDALTGKEATEEQNITENGGSLRFSRPAYDAVSMSFTRNPSAPQLLKSLTINNAQGDEILALGDPASPVTTSASSPTKPDANASETAILAHSRHDPDADWQKPLFIVPFFTAAGELHRVVGNYQQGDSLRFNVHNSADGAYATLKRTQLDNGQHVWMLPEHASIMGGGKSSGSSSSSSSSSRSNGASAVSDNKIKQEASSMLSDVMAMGNPDELDDHIEMLELMAGEEKEPGLRPLSDNNIRLRANGQTVGLMTMAIDKKNKEGTSADDQRPALWIDKIITRPGTYGNGKTLLAMAMATSERNGLNGVVRAFVHSGHDFYEGTGFHEVDGQIQELDPRTSTCWQKSGGQWHYLGNGS